jgi:hypothetical protein
MEQFFVNFVFPEFASPYGYLRAISYEMYMFFDEIEFNEQVSILFFLWFYKYRGFKKRLL